MIVNNGKIMTLYVIKGDTTTYGYPAYMGCGTGTTAEQATDTALQTQNQRVALTSVTIDTVAKNITFRGVFTFTGAAAITEFGLFQQASGGYMFSRKVRTAINVINGTVLTMDVVWSW